MAIDFRADHERLAQLEARGLGDDVSIWKYSDYLVGTIEEYGEQYVPRFLAEFEKVKSAALVALETTDDIEGMLEIYWQAVRHLAPWRFEDFMLYMEKNRPFKKRFYAPRRNTLHIVAEDLQALEDGKYEFYGLSLPPRVGKSTISCFFMAWIIGKRPASHNAMGAHSEILASNFYSEVLTLTTSADYTFSEIFPGVKLKRKQGKPDMTLDYGTGDNFATFTCRGIDGTWTGAVDVSSDGYLYTDDLIRDRQESLSAQRLNKRYQDYLNVMKDRKNDGARELMIGTRWNVIDPLGQIEEQFGDDPRYFFRRIPALDENDESNFKYAVKGFSTEYYHDMRAMLDPNEWQAKYMQRPFVREGLLFPEDELRYFNGVLPAGGFKRVVSACDVAFGGGDSLSMPIGYEYENGDVYIVDWVFNSGAKEVTIPLVAGKILENEIQQIRFEANNGGDIYANYIDEELKKHRYPCAITHRRASTKTAKFEKVIQCAGDIKRRFIFLADNVTIRKASGEDTAQTKRYYRSQEYTKAMDELLMYVQIGKNEHDDAADSLAQLVQTIGGSVDVEVQVMRRFF